MLFFPKLDISSKYSQFSLRAFKNLSFLIKYQPLKGKGFLLNLIFSFTISGLITTIDIYQNNFELSASGTFGRLLLIAVLTMVGLTVFGYPIVISLRKINQKFPWSEVWMTRLIVDISLIIIISILSAIIFSLVLKDQGNARFILKTNLFKYFTFSFIACMTFVLMVEAIVFFNQQQHYLNRNEMLARENLETRFEVLKNQINPHFLFNNLNVLSSLVYQDPKLADQFIVEFSNIYRYILDMQGKTLVTVQEELAFLDSYVYLLKKRFQDGILIVKEISDNNLARKVPPLTFQILMENVVKHNIISAKNPLTVSLTEEGNTLIFQNNVVVRNHHQAISGVGLKNIQERYSVLGSKSVMISESEGYFKVMLPLLQDD